VGFGAGSSAAAQERSDVQPAEAKGEGVYNTVEGKTTIVSIKPLGSRVTKGELVCELESFAVRARLAKQELTTKAAEAPYEYAKRAREIAELGVTEYLEGIFAPQLKAVDRDIALAESELKRAEQTLATMKRMVEKGLGPQSRVDAATLTVQQARLSLEKSQGKKSTLQRFTKERKLKELQSKVERARAEELARQADCGREQSALEQLKKQIEHCKLLAPTSGRLIYSETIEEGADVSQGELLFRVVPEAGPKAVK
jgi:multidrug resistance efflux pump